MTPPPDAIAVVRMYNQGFGDCFLLAFPREDARPFYVWLDCGVLRGTPQAGERMQQVLANLHAETEGGRPDVLVVTHEHWDHLSGFEHLVRDEWSVGSVWQSWLENPADEDARPIRELRKEAERSLTAAVQALPAESSVLTFVNGILQFSEGTRTAFNVARGLGPIRYLSPGDELDEIPGVKTYVLGPPRAPAAIKDISTRKNDVYHLAQLQGLVSQELPGDLIAPFDESWGLKHDVSAGEFFSHLYWSDTQRWRSIDESWQLASGSLAMQLANLTNNTSLVLAFELSDGRVLLFPGDAQTGNWKSWDSVGFPSGRTAEQLLSNTAFYKASHHGSHNGTLSTRGLERMKRADLAAVIPVDQATALRNKWPIPLDALVTRLAEVTNGRVARPDRPVPSGFSEAKEKLVGTDQPLYFDYILRKVN